MAQIAQVQNHPGAQALMDELRRTREAQRSR
jgi:hypothetical protein